MSQTQNPAPKTVSIAESIKMLKNGYTRYKKDEKEEGKSIQSFYGLTGAQAKVLFGHEKLRNLKTIQPVEATLLIIDDTADIAPADTAAETVVGTEPTVLDDAQNNNTDASQELTETLVGDVASAGLPQSELFS